MLFNKNLCTNVRGPPLPIRFLPLREPFAFQLINFKVIPINLDLIFFKLNNHNMIYVELKKSLEITKSIKLPIKNHQCGKWVLPVRIVSALKISHKGGIF